MKLSPALSCSLPETNMKRTIIKLILLALPIVLRYGSRRHSEVRKRIRERDCVVQIKLKDNSLGRHYIFKQGKIQSRAGLHGNPDLELEFRDIPTALIFLKPPLRWAEVVHAAKSYLVVLHGSDELAVWFMQLVHLLDTAGLQKGTPMADGTVRYTTNTLGGRAQLVDSRARAGIHAATPGDGQSSRADTQVTGVFGQSLPVSDAARRLRP